MDYNPNNHSQNSDLASDISMELGYNDFEHLCMELFHEGCIQSYCFTCEELGEEYEPDCTDGWCEHCNTNTSVSVFVLGGVI